MARVSLVYEECVHYLRDLVWCWMLQFLLIIIFHIKVKAFSFTRFAAALCTLLLLVLGYIMELKKKADLGKEYFLPSR